MTLLLTRSGVTDHLDVDLAIQELADGFRRDLAAAVGALSNTGLSGGGHVR
jgi:hypothetical protein